MGDVYVSGEEGAHVLAVHPVLAHTKQVVSVWIGALVGVPPVWVGVTCGRKVHLCLFTPDLV